MVQKDTFVIFNQNIQFIRRGSGELKKQPIVLAYVLGGLYLQGISRYFAKKNLDLPAISK